MNKLMSLVAGLIFSTTAYAGWFDSTPQWREYTTDSGCVINLSYRNYFDASYSWDGACKAGKGITGKGVLKQISSGGDCAKFSGEMVNGYWIGSVHRDLYDTSCGGKVYDSRHFSFPVPDQALLVVQEPEPEPVQKQESVQEVFENAFVEVKLTNDLGDGCKQIHIFNKSEKFLEYKFVYVYEFSNGNAYRKTEESPSGGGVRSRSTVGMYLHSGPPGNFCKDGYGFKLEDFSYRLE